MLTGTCLCETIRFEVTGAPVRMVYCHCLQCRRSSGSSFATVVIVKRADFRWITGRDVVGTFESRPGKLRHFCPRCGSPVFNELKDGSGDLSVRAGALEQDPGLRPTLQIWTDSMAPWISLDERLPSRPES